MPGVTSPLGWTFWHDPIELGALQAFCDLGVIKPADVRVAAPVDHRLNATFYGRYAVNVDRMRGIGDLMPGTSADAIELQLMGGLRPGIISHPSRRRYPMVITKMPVSVLSLPGRLAELRSEIDMWWQACTATDPVDVSGAVERLLDARQRCQEALRLHCAASMMAQGLYDQLTRLASSAGQAGLEMRLATGYGGVEETRVAMDLWHASRGELSVVEFLLRHGYQGPGGAEISQKTWRDDPEFLEGLLDRYRTMSDELSPENREHDRASERHRAEAELLAGLPRHQRPKARLLLRLARRYIPLREVGKVAFLQTIDVARVAARALGRAHAEDGLLANADDVFYLTVDELRSGLPEDVAAIVTFRRAQRARYLTVRLPERWTGMPVPIEEDNAVAAPGDRIVTGLPVSPGMVEGVARVVTDPGASDMEPGDVLVCETTDPSWVSLFLLASAVVIDVGGPMSHGAIVARELGIPGVINTNNGTRAIRTGDRVRVDGLAGTVEIL